MVAVVYSKKFLQHDTGTHPERKERLIAIIDFLQKKGFKEFEQPLELNEKELLLVHKQSLINDVKRLSRQAVSTGDNVFNSNTFEIAKLACGAALKAAELSEKEFAFSLARPPGHHAGRNFFGGFCYFNNIAFAAKQLLVQKKAKKVAIIDLDCHFGNGTADIFYSSPQVLYFSMHQFPAFPGNGWVDEIGEGDGKGYTINVPLPLYTADDLYIGVLKKFVLLIKEQFKPDAVAVSMGFDAHHSDPLTEMNLSNNSFYEFGKIFRQTFRRVFICLEGGYNLAVLPYSVYAFIKGLNGKEMESELKEKGTKSDANVMQSFEKRIKELNNILSDYWEL